MKILLTRLLLYPTICLLVISTSLIGSAQRNTPRRVLSAPGNSSLNRTQTRAAEHQLSVLGYWTGAIDGVFDPASRAALIAFQKWEGRLVTGQLTISEVEAIRTASLNDGVTSKTSGKPKPKESGYAHVEVDVDKQVMLIINDRGDVRVLHVSTGNDKPFMEDGQKSIAYTPRGRFLVYDKSVGWEKGYLGSMYYSNYISGGVAIHGHPNVPNQPASHGCIRVPMFAARELSELLALGTIVLVYDKESFVSAKEWVENPKQKEAALLDSATPDYDYFRPGKKGGSKSVVIKKTRAKITRAD